MVHFAEPFRGWWPAMVLVFLGLHFAAMGSGRLGLDNFFLMAPMSDEDRLTAPERRVDDQDPRFAQNPWASSLGRRQRGRTCECSSRARAARGEAMDHVLFFGPPGSWQKPLWRRSSRARWGSAFAARRASDRARG